MLGFTQPCAYQEKDGAQGVIQEASKNHEFHKDPLQGIEGPMTRSRAKRMKQALHGLLVQLQGDEATWNRASMETMSPSFITYLWAEPRGK